MSIQITAPVSGATVKPQQTVKVTVTGSSPLRVTLRVDGVIKARPKRAANGEYAWTWYTTNYTDGMHSLTASIGDAGALQISATLSTKTPTGADCSPAPPIEAVSECIPSV